MGKTQSSMKNSGEAAQLVQEAISNNPVVIFSKSYCPYCVSAKRDIANAGKSVAAFEPPKIYELNDMGALGSSIQSYLAQTTGRRTVPNVFIGGKPVGGGDEVSGYASRGVLKQMLAQAPSRLSPGSNEKAKQVVEEAIEKYPVVVFSKTTCPYCRAAKNSLNDVKSRVEQFEGPHVVEVNTMGELGVQIQEYLAEKTGRRTVPNVFLSGKSVGGGDDIRAHAAQGRLDAMIAHAIGAEEPTAATSVKDIVEDAIAKNPIAVFSKSYCPYCMRAKALLVSTGKSIEGFQQPKILELDEMSEGESIQQYLFEKTGQRTVPSIFIGGKHIGGSSELSEVAGRNALVGLIQEAHVPPALTETTEDTEVAPGEAEADASTTEAVESEGTSGIQEIVFGAGCFWGVELAFQRVNGVVSTEVGYSNGKIPRVTYDAVCSGLTGSAEVVKVSYDPNVVTLGELLKVWESRHDPTSLNKQGNDMGTQYRSAVYYANQAQADEIAKWNVDASQRLGRPVVTEIAPVKNYCEAEEYHQRYLEKKGQSAEKGATTPIRCYG